MTSESSLFTAHHPHFIIAIDPLLAHALKLENPLPHRLPVLGSLRCLFFSSSFHYTRIFTTQ
ncbi:hypothetical protein I79_015987 [Cricetulus griseus]|uniref:Uncharacterized protein n=1 Tax=Cricetulus griseus TaxID=10029 RepID=G3HY69_CRIGR|nr:hypothetical protein I79_015987 [Cricetulus griseus]